MDKTDIKEELRNTDNDKGAEKISAEDITRDENMKAVAEDEAQKSSVQAEDETEQNDATDKLKEELEAAKDKYLRLYSEFENFRKRTAKEKLELIQSANEQLLLALLPVADDFERAENSFSDKTDKDLAGFFLIHSKFKKVLELYGAKAMEISQGTDFDADYHEAISQVPSPAPELKGKIVDVVEKGYMLYDKVIRYAKVVVGN